jgi:hypothetical protein
MIATKHPVTAEQLRALRDERPDGAGGAWKGLPHYELIASVRRAAENRGFGVAREEAALTPDGKDCAASLTLFGDFALGDGVPAVGLLNSNARRHALTAFLGVVTPAGAGVPLCVLLRRKHSYRGEGDVGEAVCDKLRKELRRLADRVERLKARGPSYAQAAGMLFHATKVRKGIAPSRVVFAERLYRGEIGSHNDLSYWGLLTAFALAARKSPPVYQMQQVYGFLKTFPEKVRKAG